MYKKMKSFKDMRHYIHDCIYLQNDILIMEQTFFTQVLVDQCNVQLGHGKLIKSY